MDTNTDFLKNLKVGDEVILETNNYFLQVRTLKINTIKGITKDKIILRNNYEFNKDGSFDKNTWYYFAKILECTEENIKEYEEFNKSKRIDLLKLQ